MSWFELTLILSLAGSTLVMSLRAITPETNPFLFMAIVTTIASCASFAYCALTNTSVMLNNNVLVLTMLAGLSVATLDMAFIFMFRKGAPVAISMPIFRAMAIMISALIGIAFFKEEMSATKGMGIVVACIAVYLLNSKSIKVQQ